MTQETEQFLSHGELVECQMHWDFEKNPLVQEFRASLETGCISTKEFADQINRIWSEVYGP